VVKPEDFLLITKNWAETAIYAPITPHGLIGRSTDAIAQQIKR